MTFEKAFEELKKIAGGEYCCLEYKMTKRASGHEEVDIQAYVNNYGHTANHRTFQQALDEVQSKLKTDDPEIDDKEKNHELQRTQNKRTPATAE